MLGLEWRHRSIVAGFDLVAQLGASDSLVEFVQDDLFGIAWNYEGLLGVGCLGGAGFLDVFG